MNSSKSPTISTTTPFFTGQDFATLRKEGLSYSQRLSGEVWTDYNIHDPGVTILEHLCYAITDLSYRLSFNMQDLLFEEPQARDLQKLAESKKVTKFSLLGARESLTASPLTLKDYRKLLLDIEGVRDANVEPYTKEVKIEGKKETYKIKGFYNVTIEPIKLLDQADEDALKAEVKAVLQQNRSLGVDFHEIKLLTPQVVTVAAEIEIREEVDANNLMAELCIAISDFLSPKITFYSAEELLARGMRAEDIFDGPSLENGIIVDEELKRFKSKEVIYPADIISLIFHASKIKVVKEITLTDNITGSSDLSELTLEEGKFWQLEPVERLVENIKFYRNNALITPDLQKIKDAIKAAASGSIGEVKKTDLPLPVGRYRNLSDYRSILEDFPSNYGVGEAYMPSANATPERIAQVRQLKGYLFFYDQILLNYFSALAGTAGLFNLNDNDDKSAMEYMLAESNNYSDVTGSNHKAAIHEGDKSVRIDKLLNHLLARFGENLQDQVVDLKQKTEWLTNYALWSRERDKGFDYISGDEKVAQKIALKQRISTFLSKSIEFYVIEHILLRPFAEEDWEKAHYILRKHDKEDNPYSCYISFVFPGSSTEEEQERVRKIITREMPLHLRPNFRWPEESRLELFRYAYGEWLKQAREQQFKEIDGGKFGKLIPANKLMDICMDHKGIGIMTIETDFIVA